MSRLTVGSYVDANKRIGEFLESYSRRVESMPPATCPIAVQQSKMAINNGMNTDLRTGCRLEIEGFQQCFASEDRVEGMSAFVEKRDPVFQNK